jgi:hypothetical protein
MLLRAERIAAGIPPRQILTHPTEPGLPPDQIKPGRYQAFEQHKLRIAVTELHSGNAALLKRSTVFSETRESLGERVRSLLSFELQSHTIKSRLHSATEKGPRPEAAGQEALAEGLSEADTLSLEYMDEQVRDSVVPAGEKTYDTIRLDSVRTDSRAHVHVFEMYWADLSRPVGNLMRWLMEFYQLLFDLCMVGRKSLAFACAEYQAAAREERRGWAWLWPVFAWSQLIAEQALALAVPILGLYLLALACAVSPLFLNEGSLAPAIIWSVAGIAAVAIGLGVYFLRHWFSSRGRAWPFLILLPLGAASVVRFFYLRNVTPEIAAKTALIHAVWLAWWLPVIGILALMFFHQRTRRGAFPMGLIIGGFVAFCFVPRLSHAASTPKSIFTAVIQTADYAARMLLAAWVVAMLCAAVATLVGFFIGQAVPGRGGPLYPQARDRVRRAAWTANLTLVLPALTVLILNLSLWQALIVAFVPDSGTVGTGWNRIKSHEIWETEVDTVRHSFKSLDSGPAWKVTRAMVERASTPLYFAIAGLFGLGALLLIWSIIPAIIVEIRPGAGKDPLERRERKSSWLGQSLTAGFRAMRVSGEIVRAAFLLFLPVVVLVTVFRPKNSDVSQGWNRQFLYFGAAIVLGVVASRGPFKVFALGLRSGLDVALDVINWLRLHPRDANPRGRICARYASLLREVEQWRDPGDETQGYDAIVILAHSQGTVITADLLRYLRANRADREKMGEWVPSLPIYFFTMGCPLRQLYSLRFPHLYGWARHADETWAGSEPLPSEIDVKLWVNAYRSGDYVGRYLWHPDSGQDMWSTRLVHVNAEHRKREFCIGAGAHTHYWDETAPEIAVELDRIVGLAARNA